MGVYQKRLVVTIVALMKSPDNEIFANPKFQSKQTYAHCHLEQGTPNINMKSFVVDPFGEEHNFAVNLLASSNIAQDLRFRLVNSVSRINMVQR